MLLTSLRKCQSRGTEGGGAPHPSCSNLCFLNINCPPRAKSQSNDLRCLQRVHLSCCRGSERGSEFMEPNISRRDCRSGLFSRGNRPLCLCNPRPGRDFTLIVYAQITPRVPWQPRRPRSQQGGDVGAAVESNRIGVLVLVAT